MYKLHTIDEIKEQLDEVDEDIKTLDDQVAYFPIIVLLFQIQLTLISSIFAPNVNWPVIYCLSADQSVWKEGQTATKKYGRVSVSFRPNFHLTLLVKYSTFKIKQNGYGKWVCILK